MAEPCVLKTETDPNEILNCLRFVNQVLKDKKIPIYFGLTIDDDDGEQLMFYDGKEEQR